MGQGGGAYRPSVLFMPAGRRRFRLAVRALLRPRGALDVARVLPRGERRGVVSELVAHDCVEASDGVYPALDLGIYGSRRGDLRVAARVLSVHRALQVFYLGLQVFDEGRGQFVAYELGLERDGVGDEGARRLQQCLIAA